MDDLGQQFNRLLQEVQVTLKKFPKIASNTAVNFFKDSFKQQAWRESSSFQPWKSRSSKKDKGRAILVKSGDLKRSIRELEADWNRVAIGTDVPYASVHNDGFKGTQNIRAHARQNTKKIKVKYSSIGSKKTLSKKQKINAQKGFVKQHTRNVNIPKRKFMGNSNLLDLHIKKKFIDELNKL